MFNRLQARVGDQGCIILRVARSQSHARILASINTPSASITTRNFHETSLLTTVTKRMRKQRAKSTFSQSGRLASTAASPSAIGSVQTNTSSLPLKRIKILDLSRVLAGPFATQILSDLGADVLKIEQPGVGDETRQWRTAGETAQMWKPEHKLMSLYFCAVNRNKRSCVLNLKSDEGKEIVRKLVTSMEKGGGGYDVVVSNFLPGKLDKMGLGYKQLRDINPSVVLAEVSGYGANGPWSQRAGYDAVALAEAGLLHITGEPNGPPIKPGVAIGDLCTGLYVHGAILAAVLARTANGGAGCKIEGSLYESAVTLLINVGLASLNLDRDQTPANRRRGQRFSCGHPNLVPYNRYRTKDEKWFFIAANNNIQWQRFCQKLNLVNFGQQYETNDSRVENRREIDNALSLQFRERTMPEWLSVFEGSGLPYGPVNDVVDALEHPQADARNMVVDLENFVAAKEGILKLIGPAVKLSGTQPMVRLQPPLLGQHTNEVLAELGYSREAIQNLMYRDII